MPAPSYREGTRVVRAGLPEAEQGTPFLPGPTFAAPYHLTGDPASSDYVYGRYGNPSWSRYESALGELEGGTVVLFSSGWRRPRRFSCRACDPATCWLPRPIATWAFARSPARISGRVAWRCASCRPLTLASRTLSTAPRWSGWRARRTPASTSVTFGP